MYPGEYHLKLSSLKLSNTQVINSYNSHWLHVAPRNQYAVNTKVYVLLK